MPILIVNHPEHPRGLVLGDRVLIGRRPFNTIMVPDPAVSRIHAWIGRREGGYVLYDAGSRAGTRVNDEPVKASRDLVDGDEIRVGPTTIVYREAGELPGDVEPIDQTPTPPAADPYDGGIYFDCTCGGPMWVGADMAGATGKCRYCGRRLVVPHLSGQKARSLTPTGEPPKAAPSRPATVPEPVPTRAPEVHAAPTEAVAAPTEVMPASAPPPAPPPPEVLPVTRAPEREREAEREREREPAPPSEVALAPTRCSICQTAIAPGEEQTTCPSCGLEFHGACWRENYGCSAYGCDQVNVLAPPEERQAADADVGAPLLSDDTGYEGYLGPEEPAGAFPWESVLLALSFVAMFLSALGFGVPSAVMLVAALVFLLMGTAQRKSLVVVSVVVSLLGTAAGYAMSMFWWRGERVWETFLR